MVDDRHRPPTATAKHRTGLVIVLFVLVGSGWAAWHFYGRPSARAERSLQQARQWRLARNFPQAEQAARTALELNPSLAEAAWIAAESAALSGEFQRSVNYTQFVSGVNPRLKLRASMLAAEINHRELCHLDAAETAYRVVLKLDPEQVAAHAGLAHLLGMCGRRREAIPHVLKLVSLGEPTDLLVLLAREDGAVNDRDTLEKGLRANPQDSNAALGLAWLATESGDVDGALRLLRSVNKNALNYRRAYLTEGRTLAAAERFPELTDWLQRIPSGASEFEMFFALGRLADHRQDLKGALRSYWEAVKLAPESKAACFRLSRLLAEVGENDAAQLFADHVGRLQELALAQDRVLFSNAGAGVQPLLDVTQSYEAVGRLWEAYGWCLMAAREHPADVAAQRRLAVLRKKVTGVPLKLTVDAANPAFTVDLTRNPLPTFRPTETATKAAPATVPATVESNLSFRNDAASVGLHFRYFNGTEGSPSRRMFEFTGGGVGVIDFDLDGFPDVAFTQGCRWPPGSGTVAHRDRLFRNARGQSFHDVTSQANLVEQGFGQGLTVGDFNADGFPDWYVANIGANVLWMNNGDGTFTDVTGSSGLGGNTWTTSCVLADLSGDGLPDIYDVNYVMGQDVFDRICRHQDGSPKICMPFDFDGEPDRLWVNDGQGGFRDATRELLTVIPGGKGLGVAVWDAHGQGRLSLLVANDTTPNFFFEPAPMNAGTPRLTDRGVTSGLAFNGDGKATASMGIALADVTGDGQMDVHITNFAGESNTLFVNSSEGAYEDRSRAWGLPAATVDWLGFGTQFLDVDLDGKLELFVSNGHIDDWRQQGRAYEMPPLLFRQRETRLERVDARQLGPYFAANWLGRSAARIDWNRDGREDLIVGHLLSDSALLTNTTAPVGRFLCLRLCGVQSNRDALGATVRVRIGKHSVVRQLTAGDGYQASNERRLVFGVGQAERIDELEVRWPSGKIQRFFNVAASQDACLPEGGTLHVAPNAELSDSR